MPEYQPVSRGGTIVYTQLRDVPLPPVINSGQYAGDLFGQIQQTPGAPDVTSASAPRTFPFPVETDNGRWYVIVVLGAHPQTTGLLRGEVARPLMYLMAVLLGATMLTAVLVWRFTRPIRDLSSAARLVAQGDFTFRVPAENRRDEMGDLAGVFNEMISKLGRTRELEAQLHQAEQSAVVGRLASAIAHEIRNPLNYINLTLDHLRNAFAPEDPEKRATFERLAVQLKVEVARINSRITEFLSYSRASQLELSPVDVTNEIEDALRMVEVDAAEHGVKTEIVQNGDRPMVMADSTRLRSVFTNLIINGLHAIGGEAGRLTISLSSDQKSNVARIEVADTGRGIRTEDIPKVFEPYFSTKETGTGLGLAIVKKVVDDHGGTIDVKSKPGEGTKFTVTLPLSRKDKD
jgi:signal transduction histidine kinase